MMKAEAAPAGDVQQTYEQPSIQFDDQVDVVFQLDSSASQSPKAAEPEKKAE